MFWVIGLILLAVLLANLVAKKQTDERLPEQKLPIKDLLFEFRDLNPEIELEILLGLYFETGRSDEDRQNVYERLERLTASHSKATIQKRIGLIEEQIEHKVLLDRLLIENGFDTAMELADIYPDYIHQQKTVTLIWELISHLGSVARKNFIRYLEQSDLLDHDERVLFSNHRAQFDHQKLVN